MIRAAQPYVRIMVRVPEAYHLVREFEAIRPGLLVLDADGRDIDSLPLTGAPKPEDVAQWLLEMGEETPLERFKFTLESPGAPEASA